MLTGKTTHLLRSFEELRRILDRFNGYSNSLLRNHSMNSKKKEKKKNLIKTGHKRLGSRLHLVDPNKGKQYFPMVIRTVPQRFVALAGEHRHGKLN